MTSAGRIRPLFTLGYVLLLLVGAIIVVGSSPAPAIGAASTGAAAPFSYETARPTSAVELSLFTTPALGGGHAPDVGHRYDDPGNLARASARPAAYRLAPQATSFADDGARFVVDSAGNATVRARGPRGWVDLSPHAAQRLTRSIPEARDGQSFAFTYDPQGNRTAKKTAAGAVVASYCYDQANRLVSTGSTGYVYDGDGIRTAKTGTGATSFVWEVAEGLPLVLADATTRYVTGPGGLPIQQVTASGVVSYYHADQLGSTRALTGSTGKVVATYTYDPLWQLGDFDRDDCEPVPLCRAIRR